VAATSEQSVLSFSFNRFLNEQHLGKLGDRWSMIAT
jgi:hypothetical protein